MDYLLKEIVRRVANVLRRFERLDLCGGVPVLLNTSEVKKWDEFILEHPAFLEMQRCDAERSVSLARIAGGDLSPEAEQRFQAADLAHGHAHDAMRAVATEWYDALCDESPRPFED